MRYLPRAVSVAALAFACALVALVPPAQAQILGDQPLIVLTRSGNELQAYEVSGLMATKGIVQAQASDRFVLEVAGIFTDKYGIVVGTVGPTQLALIPDKDASQDQGSEVTLTGIIQSLAEPRPDPAVIKELLDAGETLTLSVSVSLVLVDGSGALRVLDTIQASTLVQPEA